MRLETLLQRLEAEQTTLALQALLQQQRPASVLVFGVAGAYPQRHRADAALKVGDLCVVGTERLADEGVAKEDGFLDLAQMGLGDVGPFAADTVRSQAIADALGCPIVGGATVSTCSGTETLSAAIAKRTGAAIETMEGAALALACQAAGVPWVELRAISNWTGARARGGWDLSRATAALHAAVRRLLA